MNLTFRKAKTPVVDFGQIPEGHMVSGITEDGMLVVGITDHEIPKENRNDISKYDVTDTATPYTLFRCSRANQARVLAEMFDELWKRMKGAE